MNDGLQTKLDRALQKASAMGLVLIGHSPDDEDSTENVLPAARPQPPTRTEFPSAESLAVKIRKLEQLRQARDRYLEHARTNQMEADAKIEEDIALQSTIIDQVGSEPSIIDVDGVLYEISSAGVHPTTKTLIA
ncbi:MAG: hypothetical protein AAFV88_14060 [Planctomycetota bacterium]